jgi:hypothetical protein
VQREAERTRGREFEEDVRRDMPTGHCHVEPRQKAQKMAGGGDTKQQYPLWVFISIEYTRKIFAGKTYRTSARRAVKQRETETNREASASSDLGRSAVTPSTEAWAEVAKEPGAREAWPAWPG